MQYTPSDQYPESDIWQKKTVKTYEDNLAAYLDKTPEKPTWEMKERLDTLLTYSFPGASILEFGTWTWRDADYFQSLGYTVQRSDIATSFLVYNTQREQEIISLDLLEYRHDWVYDILFANAVFLHFTPPQLEKILGSIKKNLLVGWILGCSFKKWIWEELSTEKMPSPRYFKYRQEDELAVVFGDQGYTIVDMTTTGDDKWIHLIAKK